MKNWGLSALFALGVAFASHALAGLAVTVLETGGITFGRAAMPVLLAGQGVVFLLALMVLAKRPEAAEKLDSALIWSGWLLLATLPILIGITILEAQAEAGGDHGGAAAAFFMLLIFGGFYGGLGAIILFLGTMLRRQRKARSGRPRGL